MKWFVYDVGPVSVIFPLSITALSKTKITKTRRTIKSKKYKSLDLMTGLVVCVCVPDDIAKQHFTHRNLRHGHLQFENKEPQVHDSVGGHQDTLLEVQGLV